MPATAIVLVGSWVVPVAVVCGCGGGTATSFVIRSFISTAHGFPTGVPLKAELACMHVPAAHTCPVMPLVSTAYWDVGGEGGEPRRIKIWEGLYLEVAWWWRVSFLAEVPEGVAAFASFAACL